MNFTTKTLVPRSAYPAESCSALDVDLAAEGLKAFDKATDGLACVVLIEVLRAEVFAR